MAASMLGARTLAKFSGLLISESRSVLTRSTKVCGAWHQSCYLSTEHPGMPKRPYTPYFLFMKEKRPSVVAENPDASISVIGSKVGELWRGLSDDEKKAYKTTYEENKKIYDMELEEFKESISAEEWASIQKKKSDKIAATKKRKAKKAKRERKEMLEVEGKPRAVPTIYAMFVADEFKENKKTTLEECAQKWVKLPKSKKEEYKKTYNTERAAYEIALEKWKKDMIDRKKDHLLVNPETLKKKKEKEKKKKKAKAKSDKKKAAEGGEDHADDANEDEEYHEGDEEHEDHTR